MVELERTKRRAYLLVHGLSIPTILLVWVVRAGSDLFVRYGFPPLALVLGVTFWLVWSGRVRIAVLERFFFGFLAVWGWAYLVHTLYGPADPATARQEMAEGVFPVLLALCVLAHIFFEPRRATLAAGGVAGAFTLSVALLLARGEVAWPVLFSFGRLVAFTFSLLAWLYVLALTKEHLAAERTHAITDTLTGALNRRGIFAAFDVEAERHRRHAHSMAVVLFDVDHFKRINDRFGHGTGDRVLVAVVRCVQESIRPSDYLARWGGEEFVLLLPETDLPGAVEVAERLRQQIACVPLESGPVTASFGVTEFTATDNLGTLVRRADRALYRAKQGGRNTVVAEPAGNRPEASGTRVSERS